MLVSSRFTCRSVACVYSVSDKIRLTHHSSFLMVGASFDAQSVGNKIRWKSHSSVSYVGALCSLKCEQ